MAERPNACSSKDTTCGTSTGLLLPTLYTRQGAALVPGSGASPDQPGLPSGMRSTRRTTALTDVIDIGEIAAHVSGIKQPDRTAFHDGGSKNEHGHVGPAPRSIDGEKAKPPRRQAKQMAVGMRHQLIRLFARRIEADRMVDILMHGKRQARIGAVNRGGGRKHKMSAAVVPAPLEHIEKALDVGVDIGLRVDQRVAHTRLRREMHHIGKAMFGKQLLHSVPVRQVELNEAKLREGAC